MTVEERERLNRDEFAYLNRQPKIADASEAKPIKQILFLNLVNEERPAAIFVAARELTEQQWQDMVTTAFTCTSNSTNGEAVDALLRNNHGIELLVPFSAKTLTAWDVAHETPGRQAHTD